MGIEMNINIYYGGRGMIDDPTLYVVNKMQEVLEELHVHVMRYNLFEQKNDIPMLPQTRKNADGIILASTVEWYGIGGYMHQFLDACWHYGDKERISNIYMCPVVMSTTYGERQGQLDLTTAWEILGGLPCSGICGYIEDTLTLEMNEGYKTLIEKNTENIYRTINQKIPSLPASNQVVKQRVAARQLELTPQESEQLSQFVSDDIYVQRQKEDIQELASIFRDMLGESENSGEEYIKDFQQAFRVQPAGVKATYAIQIEGKKMPLVIRVDGPEMQCEYTSCEQADVKIQVSPETLNDIIHSRMTFQRAFMTGGIVSKGYFKVLRALDQIFIFPEK